MRIVPIQEPADPVRLPALLWDVASYSGDLSVAETGDFVSGADIETAVLICLMTDRRVEPFELPEGEQNRGWPGDGFDKQGGPLGSKLWLLRRRALTPGIETEAEDYAREALQTLIDQQLVARVDVTVVANRSANRLELSVALYGRDGQSVYHKKFAVLWESMDAS